MVREEPQHGILKTPQQLFDEAVEGVREKQLRDALAVVKNTDEKLISEGARDTLIQAVKRAKESHEGFLKKLHLAESEEERNEAIKFHREELVNSLTLWNVPKTTAEAIIDSQVLASDVIESLGEDGVENS